MANYVDFKQKTFFNRLGTIFYPHIIASEKLVYLLYYDDSFENRPSPNNISLNWSANRLDFSMQFHTFSRYFTIRSKGNHVFWAHLTTFKAEEQPVFDWLNHKDTTFGYAFKNNGEYTYEEGCLETSAVFGIPAD